MRMRNAVEALQLCREERQQSRLRGVVPHLGPAGEGLGQSLRFVARLRSLFRARVGWGATATW
jgi:hypothetical protein